MPSLAGRCGRASWAGSGADPLPDRRGRVAVALWCGAGDSGMTFPLAGGRGVPVVNPAAWAAGPDAETGEPRTPAGAGRASAGCWRAWPAAVPVMSGPVVAGRDRPGPAGPCRGVGAVVISALLIARPPGPAIWAGGLCQAPASQPGTRPDGGHEHGGSWWSGHGHELLR